MKKLKLIFMTLSSFVLTGIKAQEAPTAAGGEASGAGDTISYSIGQVVCEFVTGAGDTINEGVQQPYEFLIVGVANLNGISISYSVFPNPSTSTINLQIENQNLEGLSFQLFDSNGNQLLKEKIISNETHISMDCYARGSYFIKVSDNNEELGTIKIIKN